MISSISDEAQKYLDTHKVVCNKANYTITKDNHFISFLFFFGCIVLCLDVGSQFPDQRLNPGCSCENAES